MKNSKITGIIRLSVAAACFLTGVILHLTWDSWLPEIRSLPASRLLSVYIYVICPSATLFFLAYGIYTILESVSEKGKKEGRP